MTDIISWQREKDGRTNNYLHSTTIKSKAWSLRNGGSPEIRKSSKLTYSESSINTIQSKEYQTVRTILKSNIKTVERGKFDTPYTHIHDNWLSWWGTGTLIKGGGNRLKFDIFSNSIYVIYFYLFLKFVTVCNTLFVVAYLSVSLMCTI